MKKIKTVAAGLGRIGWQFHLPGIVNNEGFILTAVCDPMKERLSEAYEKYSVKGYDDFYEMINTEKPELTVIASPTHLHAGQAIYAMEQGSDVFLDKPMARDLSEAELILKTKNQTGRKIMLYQPFRAVASSFLLKEIMQSGAIGDVYMIKASASTFVYRNDWQSFKKYGGGMLNNYGAHLIDKMLYLTDSKAEWISCRMRKVASAGDADDVVKILIDTKSGITLDLEINMASALELPRTMVFGTCGALTELYENEIHKYRIRYFGSSEAQKITANDELAAKDRKYPTTSPLSWHEKDYVIDDSKNIRYYDKCYEYFALDKEPIVDFSESMEVMRIMHECRLSAGWSQD